MGRGPSTLLQPSLAHPHSGWDVWVGESGVPGRVSSAARHRPALGPTHILLTALGRSALSPGGHVCASGSPAHLLIGVPRGGDPTPW